MAAHDDEPDRERAESYYRQALALADELGMRPLVAHCHLGLGRWLRRIGGHARAEEHLSAAGSLYRAMGVTLWLAQVEAERRQSASSAART